MNRLSTAGSSRGSSLWWNASRGDGRASGASQAVRRRYPPQELNSGRFLEPEPSESLNPADSTVAGLPADGERMDLQRLPSTPNWYLWTVWIRLLWIPCQSNPGRTGWSFPYSAKTIEERHPEEMRQFQEPGRPAEWQD